MNAKTIARGCWRAEVLEVTAAGHAFVRIIGMTQHAYGPCEVASNATGVVAGDRVLVAFTPTNPPSGDDVIVLARLDASPAEPEEPEEPGAGAMTPPALTDFAWVNQGGATAVDDDAGVFLEGPSGGVANLRILVQAAPAAPYAVTIAYLSALFPDGGASAGLLLRESSSGKAVTMELNKGGQLNLNLWNSPTAHHTYYSQDSPFDWPKAPNWFRIVDDSTDRIYQFSADGTHWLEYHRVSRTDFITPDQVGFMVNNDNAFPFTTSRSGIKVVHFDVAV